MRKFLASYYVSSVLFQKFCDVIKVKKLQFLILFYVFICSFFQ